MLRIYARVLAAAVVVIAAAAAVGIPKEGLGVSVLYVGSAAVFAYARFRRGEAALVRSVVAIMGSVLLVLGLLLALAMGILGFPFEGKGWEVGLAHAALGGFTMACAVLLPCDDDEGSVSRWAPTLQRDGLDELRVDGVLESSHEVSAGGIMLGCATG